MCGRIADYTEDVQEVVPSNTCGLTGAYILAYERCSILMVCLGLDPLSFVRGRPMWIVVEIQDVVE